MDTRTYLLFQATSKSLETALLRLDKTVPIGELKCSKENLMKINAFNVSIVGLLRHCKLPRILLDSEADGT